MNSVQKEFVTIMNRDDMAITFSISRVTVYIFVSITNYIDFFVLTLKVGCTCYEH